MRLRPQRVAHLRPLGTSCSRPAKPGDNRTSIKALSAELFTYTCSTANRAALPAAGFYVARGRSAGEKLETTIALTPAAFHSPQAPQREMLSGEWLGKWSRSAAKFPDEIQADQHTSFEQAIRAHGQFWQS